MLLLADRNQEFSMRFDLKINGEDFPCIPELIFLYYRANKESRYEH